MPGALFFQGYQAEPPGQGCSQEGSTNFPVELVTLWKPKGALLCLRCQPAESRRDASIGNAKATEKTSHRVTQPCSPAGTCPQRAPEASFRLFPGPKAPTPNPPTTLMSPHPSRAHSSFALHKASPGARTRTAFPVPHASAHPPHALGVCFLNKHSHL